MMPSSINQVPGAEIEETLLLLRMMQMGCSPKADIPFDSGHGLWPWASLRIPPHGSLKGATGSAHSVTRLAL